jgi:nucleoside-diphosphate-sugar epimerase
VYGLGGLWFAATVAAAEHGFVVGDGRQRVAPVLADDVAAVIAAIDDRRDDVAGVWSVAGPDDLTVDELFGLLADGDRPQHLAPANAAERIGGLLDVPFSVRSAELFAATSVADATDAAAAFGVEVTPLEDGLRLTAQRASTAAARVRRDG